MPFVDTNEQEPWERLPGWQGRFFRSQTMSFSIWEFKAGSSVHEHHHPNEEVWAVIEGELEVTIDGEIRRAGPGVVAIVPFDAKHSVRALTDGKAFVADHPVRDDEPNG
jgi:quercetin dioxygenase-like cupin family protein